MKNTIVYFLFSLSLFNYSFAQNQTDMQEGLEVATIGGGCFWCVEAVYQRLKGVEKVVSGYAGGETTNPTYEEICTGNTGHAEVTQIIYDPSIITYEDIIEIFWHVHDPTTLNRQGNDVGTQYRSIILYHNDEQKAIAENSIQKFEAEKIWGDKSFTTQVVPLDIFYEAEAYHQNYFNNNPNQGYCTYVVAPKVQKFQKDYKDRLKEEVEN